MPGTLIRYKANGHETTGYLALPQNGKGPGVIVIQEWWGLVEQIKKVCDRLAKEGYVALAPDLYHGQTTSSPDEAGRFMMALRIDQAEADLRGAVRYLLDQPGVSSRRVGCVGFSMGGQLALFTASTNPSIAVCVDYYGNHPNVNPDLSQINGWVLGFFGEKDTYVTPDAVKKLGESLNSLGKKVDFTIFPGVGHAFFNETRRESYNKTVADKSWNRMLDVFKDTLT